MQTTPPPIVPIEEICGDGFDNNFDGTIDENCENPEMTPTNETHSLSRDNTCRKRGVQFN